MYMVGHLRMRISIVSLSLSLVHSCNLNLSVVMHFLSLVHSCNLNLSVVMHFPYSIFIDMSI